MIPKCYLGNDVVKKPARLALEFPETEWLVTVFEPYCQVLFQGNWIYHLPSKLSNLSAFHASVAYCTTKPAEPSSGKSTTNRQSITYQLTAVSTVETDSASVQAEKPVIAVRVLIDVNHASLKLRDR